MLESRGFWKPQDFDDYINQEARFPNLWFDIPKIYLGSKLPLGNHVVSGNHRILGQVKFSSENPVVFFKVEHDSIVIYG